MTNQPIVIIFSIQHPEEIFKSDTARYKCTHLTYKLLLLHSVADPGIFNGGRWRTRRRRRRGGGVWGGVSPSPPGEGSGEGAGPPQKNFEFDALKCRILVQSGALL